VIASKARSAFDEKDFEIRPQLSKAVGGQAPCEAPTGYGYVDRMTAHDALWLFGVRDAAAEAWR